MSTQAGQLHQVHRHVALLYLGEPFLRPLWISGYPALAAVESGVSGQPPAVALVCVEQSASCIGMDVQRVAEDHRRSLSVDDLTWPVLVAEAVERPRCVVGPGHSRLLTLRSVQQESYDDASSGLLLQRKPKRQQVQLEGESARFKGRNSQEADSLPQLLELVLQAITSHGVDAIHTDAVRGRGSRR